MDMDGKQGRLGSVSGLTLDKAFDLDRQAAADVARAARAVSAQQEAERTRRDEELKPLYEEETLLNEEQKALEKRLQRVKEDLEAARVLIAEALARPGLL